MPVAYHVDLQAGVAIHVWHGVITSAESAAQMARLADDRDWPPARMLLDLRSVGTNFALPDVELVQLLLEETLYVDPKTPTALTFVLPPHVSMAYIENEAARRGMPCEVFESFDAACRSLGVEPAHGEQVATKLRSQLDEQPT